MGTPTSPDTTLCDFSRGGLKGADKNMTRLDERNTLTNGDELKHKNETSWDCTGQSSAQVGTGTLLYFIQDLLHNKLNKIDSTSKIVIFGSSSFAHLTKSDLK